MQNKLTIHHLAKRLPYGLKSAQSAKTFGLDKPLIKDVELSNVGNFIDGTTTAKIALFPLSALTQEITLNGNSVVPIEYISTSKADSQHTMKRVSYEQSLDVLETWKMDRLLELHFDVDYLIPAGLAISVFDLPENPYK